MSEKKYMTETTLLPEARDITVLLKQKEVTVGDGLVIQSFFVREGDGAPFVVQVLGDDAHLERDGQYTVMLKQRKQTRIADGAEFIELQVAAAQPR